jgi:hypothetical protein
VRGVSLNFTIGAPPRNAAVEADVAWRQLPGYDDSLGSIGCAIATGAAAAMVLASAWTLLAPGGLPWSASPRWASVIAVFALATVGHEAMHLLAMPAFGLRDTTVGVWPKLGSVYAQHRRPMRRNRFVAVALTPFVALSLLPGVAALAGAPVPDFVRWAGVVNAFAAGADLLVVAQLLRHAAPRAGVIESGHAAFVRAG